MKRSQTVGVIVILLICISLSASASTPPGALNSIPADCPSVVGINIRQLAASPFFARLMQDSPQTGAFPAEFAKLKELMGLDLTRDISSVILAASSVEKTKPKAVAIVSCGFDRKKIAAYARSQMASIEMDYGGASIFMIPEKGTGGTKAGFSFLGDQELALGDMESLKAVLDTRAGTKKSILTNPDMLSILDKIQYDDMFWFAANTSEVLKKASIATPLGPNQNSIQSSYGSFNFGDNITGKITAAATDAGSAEKVANLFKGLVAFGQLSGDKNPDLKQIVDRIAVTQNANQINLAFDIPGELIKKLGNAKLQQMSTSTRPNPSPDSAGKSSQPAAPKNKSWRRVTPLPEGVFNPGAPGMKPPVVLEQPLPPYTEAARKAKIDGSIRLQLIVRKDGKPDGFKIVEGLGHGLDESAIRTVATRWRFKPGTLNGEPVDTMILIEVTFKRY